jgi:hypothetical protein
MPLFFSRARMLWQKAVSTKPKVQHVKQVVSDARNQREGGVVLLCSFMGAIMGFTAKCGIQVVVSHTPPPPPPPHSLGQKEGGIHRYLDTPKGQRRFATVDVPVGLVKDPLQKKDNREFSHSHVLINKVTPHGCTKLEN